MEKSAEELSRKIARIWNKSRSDEGYTSDIAEKDAISLINQFKEDVAREWYTKGFDEMVYRTNFKGGWKSFDDYYNNKI